MWHIRPLWGIKRFGIIFILKMFQKDFLKEVGVAQVVKPPQEVRPIQAYRSSGHDSPVKFRNGFWMNFTQTLIWKLKILKLVGFLPIKYLSYNPLRVRDHILFWEGFIKEIVLDLLEREPKVPHHSWSLIQGFDFWIVGWRP